MPRNFWESSGKANAQICRGVIFLSGYSLFKVVLFLIFIGRFQQIVKILFKIYFAH